MKEIVDSATKKGALINCGALGMIRCRIQTTTAQPDCQRSIGKLLHRWLCSIAGEGKAKPFPRPGPSSPGSVKSQGQAQTGRNGTGHLKKPVAHVPPHPRNVVSGSHFQPTEIKEVYLFIESCKGMFAVSFLCRVMGVSRSGFYDFQAGKTQGLPIAPAFGR
jgi:hypothetical protein